MPILSRVETLTNLKDNVLKSLETAGGFGQGSSEPEQNVLKPFPKFTSARTMLAFVVSTCMKHLPLPILRAVLRWEKFKLDQESCRLPGFVSWELRTDTLQELWLTCNHQASLSHLGLPSTLPLQVPSWSCSWSLPRALTACYRPSFHINFKV